MNKREHEQEYPRASASSEVELTCGSTARLIVLRGGGMNVMLKQPLTDGRGHASSTADMICLGTEDMERINAGIQAAREEAEAVVQAIC
ncbi:MAG: hypothetical protein KAJ42_15465 [Gemmatimonadetes bacterium]|nr:hypothetical protein [Gemmatimonadota bacterium]